MDYAPRETNRLVERIEGKATLSKGMRIQKHPSGEPRKDFMCDVAVSHVTTQDLVSLEFIR